VSAVITQEVQGRAVALRRWEGDAPAVVLIHGAGGNHDSLARLGDALAARGAAVVAPSLPGRCGSDGPPCATAAEAAARVGALLDALGLEAPLVAGHSFGGGVALELAFAQPSRLGGLALLATGARLRVHPTILALMEEAARTGQPAPADRALWRPDTPDAVIDAAVAAAAHTPPATTLQDWRAADGFDRLGDVPRLAVPTLVVAGTEDALTPPKYARFLADGVPGATLCLLEEAGHMLPMERPDDVADAMIALRARPG
jgi:pimeloyl-ACP methyl ester carboxylesterase